MKILLCTPYKGLTPKNPGGIAIWAQNIYNYFKELRNNCCDLEIFEMDRKHESDGLSFFPRMWYGVIEYIPVILKSFIRLRKKDVHLIHINSSAEIGLLRDIIILIFAKCFKVKTVVHFHFGRIPILFEQRNWEYKFLKKVLSLTSTICVMDKKSLATLQCDGFTNAIYLPNPLSEKIVKQIEYIKNKGKKENHRAILFAGHLVPAKGVYELVEACSQISDIKLILLGHVEPYVKTELLELAKKRTGNSNWVEITGAVSHEYVIEQMLNCSVFTLPSYTEGFPNVILESMACECPIVATPVGAIADMLDFDCDNACGLKADVKDVRSLKESIEIFLDNKDYAHSCGVAAREKVIGTFSMNAVWQQLANIWNNTMVKQ